MYRKSRLDDILDIMRESGYVTVKHLTERLNYSTATINRDLNLLEKQGHIIRSYGGAELTKAVTIPLAMRYHKAHAAKNKDAKRAAELIKDGDTVFICGASTTQYMGQYMTTLKGLKVITNNISLAAYLSDHGVSVTVIGGEIVEPPSITGGMAALESASVYRIDKMFFSASTVLPDGTVGGGAKLTPMLKAVMRNSSEVYLLTDKTKFGEANYSHIVCDISDLTGVVSDFDLAGCLDTCPDGTLFFTV